MGELGPWFPAGYYGLCAQCAGDIEPDDPIRADGNDGYLCEACGQDEEVYP